MSNCAMLLLFRPRQNKENATRHQIEVAKRFKKGKAAATFCKEEVEASGGRSKEYGGKYTRKEKGEGRREERTIVKQTGEMATTMI